MHAISGPDNTKVVVTTTGLDTWCTAHGELEQTAFDQVLADAQVRNLGHQPVLVLQQHVRALQVQVHQLPKPSQLAIRIFQWIQGTYALGSYSCYMSSHTRFCLQVLSPQVLNARSEHTCTLTASKGRATNTTIQVGSPDLCGATHE